MDLLFAGNLCRYKGLIVFTLYRIFSLPSITSNIYLNANAPNGTKGGVFIYPNEKGGVLPHRPAIGLAFSISQRRRFLGG
jgi:hypothetical protein